MPASPTSSPRAGASGFPIELIHKVPTVSAGVGTITIVTSCDKGQTAAELSERRHGLFTVAMLDLLNEAQRAHSRLDLSDAFRMSLGRRMGEIAARFGLPTEQRPRFSCTGNSCFVLLDGIASAPVMHGASLRPPSTPPPLVVCPICGKHNVITSTFKCAKCGKDHLCAEHFSVEGNCCDVCFHKKEEAVKGKAQEYFDKGERFFHGRGTRKSYVRAVEYYREAADMEYSDAQCRLGECYYSGFGVSKNYSDAIKWFHKAAEHDNVRAQYMLGEMYRTGKGVSRNYKESAKWYRAASDKGDMHALLMLGLSYAQGLGMPQDSWIAYKCIRKAFEAGEKDARDHLKRLEAIAEVQYGIGEMYAKGVEVKKDLAQATSWFRRAARNGHLGGRVALGVMLLDGTIDDKNIEDAEKLLRKAAVDGNVVARKGMGVIYRRYGDVAVQDAHDDREAKKWYKKAIVMYLDAAKNDDAEAQQALAYLYWETGCRKEALQWSRLLLSRFGEEGIEAEIQLILGKSSTGEDQLKWFHKAAGKGSLVAQSCLGDYYCKGEAADLETAFMWFSKAATQGYVEAQYKLGNCLKNGVGTVQDLAMALRWYEKAAVQGCIEAEAAL